METWYLLLLVISVAIQELLATLRLQTARYQQLPYQAARSIAAQSQTQIFQVV